MAFYICINGVIMKNIDISFLSKISGGMSWEGNRQSTNVEDRRSPGLIGLSKPEGGFNYSDPNYGNEGRSNGGNSSSRVICTHFFKKGMLDQEVWRADMTFTFKNLSPATVRGYHVWAIPYVRLMRRSPLAEKIMYPLAVWRAEELAYKMGVLKKGNWKGKLVRAIAEPLCLLIGQFAKEQNWESLWRQAPQAVENTTAA
jgi:hypothetical protein